MRLRTKTLYQLTFGGLIALIIAFCVVSWNESLRQGLVRYVLAILTALGVYGCSPPASATEQEPVYHGRFVVRAVPGGQVVEGGVFVPPAAMPTTSRAHHVLIIDYTTKELLYYRKDSAGSYESVVGYAVMTPDPSFLPHAEVRGRVRDIDLAPSWCPKAQARRIYPHLPKGCVPPGHPDNMMGDAKFLINWQGVKGWEAVHLHGTNGYKAGAFWEQETLGCTRLTNEEIKLLIEQLGPQAIASGIEVVLRRGQKSEELSPEALIRLRDTAR